MRNSTVGVVLGIIILFLGLVILPAYCIGIINYRNDLNTCQSAARNFVDTVIDNHQITDKALSDLNLSLAACNTSFVYEVYREEKTTNPDGLGGSKTTWNFCEINDDTIWRTGDFCTIVIHQKGSSVYQRISSAILGTGFQTIEIRFSGYVR